MAQGFTNSSTSTGLDVSGLPPVPPAAMHAAAGGPSAPCASGSPAAISPAALMFEVPASRATGGANSRISAFAGWSADELLAAFRHRSNQAAFEEVVRRYSAMVLATCMGISKNRHDAEDAAQATFLTLAMQMRQGKEVRALGPWLQQVARRISLDQHKSAKRRTRREEIHSAEWVRQGQEQQRHDQETIHDVGDLKRVLAEELEALAPKYRLPLILHFYGGLSREQMSKELGCKPATLGVRIFRAKEMLGKRLSARGITLDGVATDTAENQQTSSHGRATSVLAVGAAAAIAGQATAGTAGCIGVGGAVLSVVLADVVRSSISDTLVRQTVEVASHLSAGTAYPGILSLGVIDLAERAVSTLALGRLRGIIAAAIISSGGIAGAYPFVEDVNFNKILPTAITAPIEQLRDLFSPAMQAPSISPIPDLFSSAPQQPTMLAMPSLHSLDVLAAAQGSGPAQSSREVGTEAAAGNAAARDNVSRNVHVWPSASAATVNLPSATAASQTVNPTFRAASGGWRGDSGSQVSGAAAAGVPAASVDTTLPRAGDQVAFVGAGSSGGGIVVVRTADAFAKGLTIGQGSAARAGVRPSSGYSEAISAATSGTSGVTLVAEVENGVVTSLRGHGTVEVGGVFDQSGTVIADGFGQSRTLSFVTSAVSNSLDNPPAGSAGWYALNGGAVSLPPQLATVPASSITWGEATEDRQIDLVNSLRLSLGGVSTPGDVAISLLPTDNLDVRAEGDLNAAALAMLSQPLVSAYSVDFGGVEASRVSFAARFDTAFLEELSGSRSAGMSVWAFDSGSWTQLNNTWLDRNSRIISGSVFLSGFDGRDFELLALTVSEKAGIRNLSSSFRVAVDSDVPLFAKPLGATNAATPPAVFIPEPTAAVGAILAGMLMLRRRK